MTGSSPENWPVYEDELPESVQSTPSPLVLFVHAKVGIHEPETSYVALQISCKTKTIP